MYTPQTSDLYEILDQYVLARINSMEGINLSLYDFDRHNAIYYFAVNSNEDIYFRYGGRDAAAANTYLNIDSLKLALKEGLKKHSLFKTGKLPSPAKPKAEYPQDIVGLNTNVVQRERCVECHHIAHFKTTEAENDGKLDKLKDMYKSPDIKSLGIHLDVPKGLVIKQAEGVAKDAGLKAGDQILTINNTPVITFGDLQYIFDQTNRKSTSISLEILRSGKKQKIRVELPRHWWITDLAHRYWTVNPSLYFDDTALTKKEKLQLGLNEDSLASKITSVSMDALLLSAHELEVGDVIIAVNGETKNALGVWASIHIRLFHRSGDTLKLDVIRNKKNLQFQLNTQRNVFRRVED